MWGPVYWGPVTARPHWLPQALLRHESLRPLQMQSPGPRQKEQGHLRVDSDTILPCRVGRRWKAMERLWGPGWEPAQRFFGRRSPQPAHHEVPGEQRAGEARGSRTGPRCVERVSGPHVHCARGRKAWHHLEEVKTVSLRNDCALPSRNYSKNRPPETHSLDP